MHSLESVARVVEERSGNAAGKPSADGAAPFKSVSPGPIGAAETFLGLPHGAWKKRRLFCLRVQTQDYGEAGIDKGTQIVVEPGTRAGQGRLVLTRENGVEGIQKIDYDDNGRAVLRPAAPSLLPFPTSGARQKIVGTIIGVLPRARSAGRATSSARRPARRMKSRERRVSTPVHERNAMILRRNLEIWGAYRASGPGGIDAANRAPGAARWRRLASRLRVLSSCLDVTHQHSLYDALADEANRIIDTMDREMNRRCPPKGERLMLLDVHEAPPTRGKQTPGLAAQLTQTSGSRPTAQIREADLLTSAVHG